MSASLHLTHGPAYAVAEITALAFEESAEPILRGIAEQTKLRRDRRLLINLLDVVGTLRPGEQQRIGVLACQHLSHLEKVASLVLPEKLTRISEAAARAQGMELRVFTSLGEAVDWLMS